MSRRSRVIWLLMTLCILAMSGCKQRYVPRPRGYYRIAIPDTSYRALPVEGYPYSFALSNNAEVKPLDEEPYWMDVVYPAFNVRIHCSYKPIHNNLRELSDDAQSFVYKHSGMADAIPEQGFENAEERVYGVLYQLEGNTASPFQFYLTDSVQHFFRGAVYFNCVPQQDSLTPVIRYMDTDVRHLIESFRWTD